MLVCGVIAKHNLTFSFSVLCCIEQQSFKPPKIKEEPTSDTEATDLGGVNVKLEVKTEVMDEPQHQNNSRHQIMSSTPIAQQKRLPCDITEERFKIPFKFGWKRELVYRSQMADTRTKSDKAEVYYITPEGKKLRTKSEIQSCLTDGLDLNMFTFAKDPLGVGQDCEIVRSAKSYTQQTQRKAPVQNFLDLGDVDPSLGFGKRVPKPKMPKGASPPPGNRVKYFAKHSLLYGNVKTILLIAVSRIAFQLDQMHGRPASHLPMSTAKMLRHRNHQN